MGALRSSRKHALLSAYQWLQNDHLAHDRKRRRLRPGTNRLRVLRFLYVGDKRHWALAGNVLIALLVECQQRTARN